MRNINVDFFKNKVYFIFVFIALVLLFFTCDIKAQTWTGSGTVLDPYMITTYQELLDLDNAAYYNMESGGFFALGNDINCTWDVGGTTFPNIDGAGTATWRWHLDGRNHTIKNLDKNGDLLYGGSTTSTRGMFMVLSWVAAPSVADTSYPIIHNVTFDSLRLGGLHDAQTSTVSIVWGALAGVATNGGLTVNNTPILDSIVFTNIQCDTDFKQKGMSEALFGVVLGYASTSTWLNRIIMKDSDIYMEREDNTNNVAAGYRANGIGVMVGGNFTNSKFTKCAISNVNLTVTEGTSSNKINAGLMSGAAHYHSEFYDCFVEGSITMIGGSEQSWLGGFFGYLDNVAGANNTTEMYGCYSAVTITGSTNDSLSLIAGGVSSELLRLTNTFADTSISTLGDYQQRATYQSFAGTDETQGDVYGSPAYGQLRTQHKKTTAWMKTQSNFEIEAPLTNGYPFDFTSIWQMDGYPTLQWSGEALSLSISSPTNGSNQIYPITVTWSGSGTFDSAYIYVNSVLVDSTDAASTYIITSGANGALPIKIATRADPTAFDSISVTAFTSGQLDLDSAYASGDSLYYVLTTANINQAVYFDVGEDTLTMKRAGTETLPDGIMAGTTYSFIKPKSFFTSTETWYKVLTTEDSVDNYVTPTLNFIGQRGGTQICWYPTQSLPIEVMGFKDVSCLWVGKINQTYNESVMLIPQIGKPTYLDVSRECSYSCRIDPACSIISCRNYNQGFWTLDTLLNDTTFHAWSETPEYVSTGIYITVNNRRYYFDNTTTPNYLYMDDITNGRDSTIIMDLSDYPAMNRASLWKFEYVSAREMMIPIATGDALADVLTRRDTTLMVLHDATDFQRSWSFNALPAPASYTQVLSDTFQGIQVDGIKRNHFRGIDPKFVREP